MDHYYEQIEGWFNYESVYSQIVAKIPNNSHVVEIGCWRGKSSTFLAVEIINSGKRIKLDCVDTWKGSSEHNLDSESAQEELYISFLKNIEPVRDVINPIRTTSLWAVSLYKDESLDFVFIDASHDYDNVSKDIAAWIPKVKKGGILAGHDYAEGTWDGVVKAVNDYFPNKDFRVESTCWIYKKL